MASDYQVIRELGKGAFGTVYLIKHKTKNEVFALKTVELQKASQEERKSAEKEAELMRDLDHDNVVRYVNSYFKGSTLFIFTEYCEGGDLAHFLQETNGVLPEKLIVCWVYQTVCALEYLHARKILHRDLKPQNIYLSGEADIKLGDLGIARVLDQAQDMATTMAGTPCYMSPEIFQMKGYNHKTDIWSFGCVVYELAAGERAFDAPILQFLIFKVVAGLVPPIKSSYSKPLQDLVKAMMAKEPDERPSASDILKRSPVKEFKDNRQKPCDIIKQSGLKTKWGTTESVVDLAGLLRKMMGFRPGNIGEGDLRPQPAHPRPRPPQPPPSPPSPQSPSSNPAAAAMQSNIYRTIKAGGKTKDKVDDKKVEVTLRQDTSRSEMTGASQAVMSALMRSLSGGASGISEASMSTTVSSSSSSSDESQASSERTQRKSVQAQFLMQQIQVLQRHCAAGIGQDTLVDAYSILDKVTNPVALKANLVELMGEDKFDRFGDKIMFLRLFEMGLRKVNS